MSRSFSCAACESIHVKLDWFPNRKSVLKCTCKRCGFFWDEWASFSDEYKEKSHTITITEEEFDSVCKRQDFEDGMDGYTKGFWNKVKHKLGFKVTLKELE
jgi:hypothetical protein